MTDQPQQGTSPESPALPAGVAAADPEAVVGFELGQEVGGRFVVEEILGSSEGGTSYLVKEKTGKRKMVLKVLDITVNEETAYNKLRDEIKQGSKVRHKNLVQVYGLGREGGAVFVAMEYVEGRTLWREVSSRRDKEQAFNPQTVFNIVGHISNALVTVHRSTSHGTLTLGNVYLTTKGKVKVANMVFGRMVSAALHHRGEGIYRTSPYVAPEVLADPNKVSVKGDVYSLAMMTVELFSATPLEGVGEAARTNALAVAAELHSSLKELVAHATAIDIDARMDDVADFRDALKTVVDTMMGTGSREDADVDGDESEEQDGAKKDAGDVADTDATDAPKKDPPKVVEMTTASGEKISFRGPAPEFAMGSTVSLDSARASEEDDDPFARAFEILGKARDLSDGGVVWGGDSDEARYLVSKDGLDYGPYKYDEVVAQLHRDEVDEYAFILDRITQERVALGDMPLFAKAVKAYVPIREEKRRKIEEQRQQVIQSAKTAGKWTVVVGVVAGMLVGVVFAIYWFYIRPEPKALPEEVLMADLGAQYKMLPPPREFQSVTANKDFLAMLFSDKELDRKAIAAWRKKHRKKGGAKGAGGAGGGDSDENISTLDFDAAGGSTYILTDQDVNHTVLGRMGPIRGCIHAELKRNPGFKGVNVRFFVKPTGTAGGVKVIGGGSGTVQSCLKGQFRTMKFPRHGGLNKGVTFPLRIQ